MATKIAVIGHGTIGKHLVVGAATRCEGLQVALYVTRKGVFIPTQNGTQLVALAGDNAEAEMAGFVRDHCEMWGVKYALLAIPSGGNGRAEAAYITGLLDRGIGIVTAGKSALANRFDDLSPHIKRIGFDATVGGGTMIPSFLREHLYAHSNHPFVLTGVMNGTLNYAQTRVRDGVNAEQICDEALRLGFAEPPENGTTLDALQMYRGEFADIARKIAIICNTRLRHLVGRTVDQRAFQPSDFSEEDLARVMAGNSCARYLVRICSRERDVEYFDDIKLGGKIRARVGEISVAAGFVKLEGALLNWVPNHVGNAVHLVQNGDTDLKIGQGAGPVPTVGAMLSNLRHFIEK